MQASFRYSLLELPDDGYMPRLADDRVGYFPNLYLNYSKDTSDTPYVRLWLKAAETCTEFDVCSTPNTRHQGDDVGFRPSHVRFSFRHRGGRPARPGLTRNGHSGFQAERLPLRQLPLK